MNFLFTFSLVCQHSWYLSTLYLIDYPYSWHDHSLLFTTNFFFYTKCLVSAVIKTVKAFKAWRWGETGAKHWLKTSDLKTLLLFQDNNQTFVPTIISPNLFRVCMTRNSYCFPIYAFVVRRRAKYHKFAPPLEIDLCITVCYLLPLLLAQWRNDCLLSKLFLLQTFIWAQYACVDLRYGA